MDSFESAQLPFNPPLYGSSNVPLPTDRLYSFRGHTAGLTTAAACRRPTGPTKVAQTTLPNESNGGSSSSRSSSNLHPQKTFPMLSAAPQEAEGPGHDHNERYSGMYASTGLDILSILSRVVNRPNPQINLGPVDLSSSIVVVDARQYDFPVIYVSPTFERLTGYAPYEVIGRNCRFLQAPDGCVTMGSCRRYTDNSTVQHIKSHMIHGKESQSSIINYRKSGQPFVNLLTVIPISFDADEIVYFVGFQVDMVEQPNKIIQNMKDGTYMVNYQQQMRFPPYMNPSSRGFLPQSENTPIVKKEWIRPASESPLPSSLPAEAKEQAMSIEALIKEATSEDGNVQSRRIFEELLLEQYPDFMHVLTIKGVFLYCSDAARSLLEYEPSELEGKSLKTVCHPSDVTTVLRELKQCSNGPTEYVNMIYRIRRKKSGYMWIECTGKLHNEDGRGRKCIVLSGRERSAYHLTSHAVTLGRKIQGVNNTQGAADDHEVWCKLDLDGLILYASWGCANVLGYSPADVIGVSVYQFLKNDTDTINMTRALAEVREGKIVSLRHTVLCSTGMEITVQSNLYSDGVTSIPNEKPCFVILQTRISDQEVHEDQETLFTSLDMDTKKKGRSLSDASVTGNMEKKNGTTTEKMISELNIECDTNWQYELHQLRICNNKLREDLNHALNRLKKNVGGLPQALVCGSCLRRIAGAGDAIEFKQDSKPMLCNSCILRQSSQSSTSEV